MLGRADPELSGTDNRLQSKESNRTCSEFDGGSIA
jgi:hypothetical protein